MNLMYMKTEFCFTCDLDCEYAFEELHQCTLCRKYIEGNYCRIFYRNNQTYYHRKCFHILKEKIDLVYDC